MKTKTRKQLALFGTFGLMATCVAAILSSQGSFFITHASGNLVGDTDYNVTLDSSNSYTSGASKQITTSSGSWSIGFAYTNASTYSNGHVTLGVDGTLTNSDPINTIDYLQVEFNGSGDLLFAMSYDGENYGAYSTIVSNQVYSLDAHPLYIKLFASENSVNIVKAIYQYDCVVDETEHVVTKTGSYTIDFSSSSTSSNTSLTTSNAGNYINEGSENISSFNTVSYIYPSGANGYKFCRGGGGTSGNGDLAFTLSSDVQSQTITNITIHTGVYKSSGSYYLKVNGGSQQTSTIGQEKTYELNGKLQTLEIVGYSKSYGFYLNGITIEYETTVIDIPTTEVGFTATDSKASKYTIEDVYDTNNGLSVVSNYSDGSTQTLSSSDYSYVVTDSNNAQIDSSAAFGTAGTYYVTVSHGYFEDQTIELTVSEELGDAYTIFIYMCGADLESSYASYSGGGLATMDITEILSVSGQPDDVNIIIQTGGASKWGSTYGISASYSQRWYVRDNKLNLISSFTKSDMGDPDTLEDFLTWGLETYPARSNGLILWNHGGAMQGVCYDENFDDNSLINSEVHQAIGNAFSNVGRTQKMDWIGYDACLMAVQDIADFNSDYFEYMVCSQETEAGYGYDYDNFIDDLYANPEIDTVDFLTALADAFVAENSSGATQSILDLSKMATYRAAWEAMASQLSSKITSSSSWSSFKTLMNSCDRFGAYTYNNKTYYLYDVFDVQDFCDKMQASSTFYVSGIDTVESLLSEVVVYNTHTNSSSDSWSNPCGLNCFAAISGYSSAADYATSETNFTTWRTINVNYGSWYSN